MEKPIIRNESIEFTQGGERIKIYKEYVKVIKQHSIHIACDIYVIDMDEPYYVKTSLSSINHHWESEY